MSRNKCKRKSPKHQVHIILPLLWTISIETLLILSSMLSSRQYLIKLPFVKVPFFFYLFCEKTFWKRLSDGLKQEFFDKEANVLFFLNDSWPEAS